MSRLPTPGSDDNTWGDILNDFLGVSHNTDGTVKTGVITTTNILDGTITTTDISATAAIVKTQLATAVQTSLGLADTALQSVPNATSAVTGIVRLTGDFGGTATAPTTPTAVHLTGAESVGGVKTFTSSIAASAGIQIGTTSTTGQVWTATNTTGNGSWQTFSSGGYGRSVNLISAATPAGATASMDYIYYWNGSTAWTLTMPTAIGNTNRYTLKNSSTINQTVATTSSQTIEGTTTISVGYQDSIDLISNGANWMVI